MAAVDHGGCLRKNGMPLPITERTGAESVVQAALFCMRRLWFSLPKELWRDYHRLKLPRLAPRWLVGVALLVACSCGFAGIDYLFGLLVSKHFALSKSEYHNLKYCG